MAIVDQFDYLWVKFSHAMVVPVVYYGYSRPVGLFWVKFSHAMVVPVV